MAPVLLISNASKEAAQNRPMYNMEQRMENVASATRIRLSAHGKSNHFQRVRRDIPIRPSDPANSKPCYSICSRKGCFRGLTHTCLGQEICQIGVVRALDDPDDAVLSNHRNHGHFLTYSGDFLGLIAEIMGREAGVCGGIGGSQHLAFRHFHSNGVQAGMTAIAVGQALARQLRGSTGIVAVMVGDGTLGQGLLYESMNLSVYLAPSRVVRSGEQRYRSRPPRQQLRSEERSRLAAGPSV